MQHIESAKHKQKVQLHNLNSGDQLMPELLKCEICDVCCSGYIPYEQHLRSEKHSKKLRMKTFMATTAENYMCGLSSFPEDTILRHQYNCPTKSDKMIKNSDTVHVVPSDKNVMLFSDKSSFYCSICYKKFNDPISYQLHLHSNIHKSLKEKEKEKDESCISPGVLIDVSNQSKMDLANIKIGANNTCSEVGDRLFCSLCDMRFTGLECAELHYKGKNHKKALSRMSEKSDSKQFNGPVAYQLPLQSEVYRSIFQEMEKGESYLSPGILMNVIESTEQDDMEIDVDGSVLNQSKMNFASIKKGENSNCSEMGDRLFCSLCNMCFTGLECAEQHYKGKKHIKELSRQSEMNDLIPKTECFSDTSNRVINFCNYEGIAERDFQKKVTIIHENEAFKL